MKSKFKLLFCLPLIGLVLSSCNYAFKTKTLSTIELHNNNPHSYVVGDTFDYQSLSIVGIYSDKTYQDFGYDQVTFTLSESGVNYDVFAPLFTAGTYTLYASKNGVKSNSINFEVFATDQYVSSISVNGESVLYVNNVIDLSLEISPSNYTVDILYSVTDETVASITRKSDTSYQVTGLKVGNTSVTFKALKDESNYVSVTHYLTISENYVTSMTVSGANSVAMNASITLTLDVNPSDFSVDITATSSNTNYATVTKLNNKSFKVTGVNTGSTLITFTAPSSKTTTVSVSHAVEVLNIQKTTIKQTYEDYIDSNYYKSSCPLSGDGKLLVIPVWFTDSSNYISNSKKENVRQDIEKAYFGSEEETGWHSVSSYYSAESNCELTLSGTVSEWYEIGVSSTTAGDDDNQATKTRGYVKNAVNWYFNKHTEDSTLNYDGDHDGFIDGVMLIYGAPDAQTAPSMGENLWAYCFWLSEPGRRDVNNPGANVFFWASYDFMYDTTTAINRTGNNYAHGDTRFCSIDAHTYIHEMGHVFGLEDYYDYASTGTLNPAGGFSMQDHNVGGHDPFSLMSFGWADPYIPNKSCTIEINDFQSSHDLILLTDEWNSYSSPFDQYFLLELYTPTGMNALDSTYQYCSRYPKGPNDVGIRLWHVDALLFSRYSSKTFISDATKSTSGTAFNNSSKNTEEGGRSCAAGDNYQKYNLLQLIRNNTSTTYSTTAMFSSSDLFKTGSSFSMEKFNKQFIDGNNLDLEDHGLGWTFSVGTIKNNGGSYSVSITFTKN